MTAFTVLLEGTPSDKPNNSGVELVHGIYPVSMEANFKPFSEFSDPDRQMRLMSLSDRAYKRAIPSLQKWSTGKQRVHFLANYMEEGPVDASATSNDLAQALRKTIDENRSLEEYIDYNVGLAQPGAFIFDAPIEIPNVVPMARSNNNSSSSSSSVMLPELHVDFPTYGFKNSAHDDIVEFLIDFGSAVELLSLQKKGWYPYLATNCRGELKSFVMDANLLPHSTDWAAAERAICKYFVEDMYKAQLSVQLIEMKPQGGEIQRAYLHRVNKVYQKYVRVTGDDGGQLLFWVFHQRLSPSLRAYVDQNLPATDKLAFPALLKIACDTRASRNPIDESPANAVDAADAAGAVQTKGKDRVIKWCGFHKSHSHSQGECKRRARGKSTTWCTYHSTANHDESDCNAAKAAGDSTTWCNYHSTSNHDESVCSAINKSAGSSSQNGNPVPRQR
ncbi:hypothetical protein IWW50_005802 [Coemansia erecta]|nr:hypothetical protein IWW50_005802 [Coemansia erecta]